MAFDKFNFNENFEVLKEAVEGVAQTAAYKTKLLGIIAKNNLTILSEEDKIKKAYTELGKVYYKDFIMEEEPDEAEYLPWVNKITEGKKKIEALRAEIADCKEQLGSDADDEIVIVPVEVAYPEEAAKEEEPAAEEAVVEEVVEEEVPVEVVQEAPACEEAPADAPVDAEEI